MFKQGGVLRLEPIELLNEKYAYYNYKNNEIYFRAYKFTYPDLFFSIYLGEL